MSALEEITPRVEQYSIDEMFLDLTGIDSCEDFEHFGRRLKAHALNTVGLPIGVGIGQTKTLAKSAQWASKEWKQFRGVLALTPDNSKRTMTLLENQPVEEVWDVGRKIGKRLNLMGIKNALQLAQSSPRFIRKIFQLFWSVPCGN
jgi:DNA polymerase V